MLSVCIPTWNAESQLARTLESLLAQPCPDLELIVCDDASDDATLEIARNFDDPRLHVHEHAERLGLAGNWNRALSYASGDTLCLFGQDDVAYPDWASTLTGLLDAEPEADLAFGRRDFVFDDEASREALEPFFNDEYPRKLAPFYARIGQLVPSELIVEEAMRFNFEINLIGEPSFVAFRRRHPAVAAGFAEDLGQLIDWEFWTRFFLAGPIAHSDKTIGAYHLHSRGASFGNTPLSIHYREVGGLLDRILVRGDSLGADVIAELQTHRALVAQREAEHVAAEREHDR